MIIVIVPRDHYWVRENTILMKPIITGRQGCNQDDNHERDENL